MKKVCDIISDMIKPIINRRNKMTDLWEYLKSTDKPIVLYGTGDGADKILDVMIKKGIKASGVFASDGFVRKRVFRDMEVLSYKQALESFGHDMIILIAFGSSLADVIERFVKLSLVHETYVPDVPVAGGELFDLDFYNKNLSKINEARALMSDEASARLYDDMIMAKLTGKVEYLLRGCESDDGILSYIRAESFRVTLDLGAYNGDTALKLIEFCPKLETVIALEPDERNFKKLCINTFPTKKVEPHFGAAWDKNEVLTFTKGGGRGIRRKGGEKTVEVAGIRAEGLLDGRKADYIKIDVEGAERQAVEGCKNAISQYKPALRIALYHKSADIFELPLIIHGICPEYKLALKRTMSFPAWDIDLVAPAISL